MMGLKKILQSLSFVIALLVALGVATFVQAQQSESGEFTLEAITVTATRRAENLQKVSRDIVAVDSETLIRSGVTDAMELPALVPGLTIARNAAEMQVSIRGVGDRTISPGTDPAIAFSLDGVFLPKSHQAMAAFFDLNRVEALKGPQGTLYGRNATAGAVNLITTKPKFDTSGFAQVEAGDYSLLRFTGAGNFAINSNFALRLSTQITDRDGYLTDGFNDDESEAVRLHLLYEPSDNTSLLLSGNYFHLGGIGEATVIAEHFGSGAFLSTVPNPSDHWAGPSDPATLARIEATNPGTAKFATTYAPDAYQDIDTYVVSATFEHRMDWGSLTLIPSLVSTELEELDYGGMIVTEYQKVKSDQYALEARIASPDDARIKWVLGGYVSKEEVSHQTQSIIPATPDLTFNSAAEVPERNATTYAFFGEATSNLTESLRLITGLRYTWEEKTIEGYTFNYGFLPGEDGFNNFPLIKGVDLPPSDYVLANILHGDKKDSALNFRVGLEYDVTDDSMLYATVATGFKAGGFFHSPVETDNSFDAEKLTAYSVGSKNRFINNRLQINAEAFYWDYTDKQETFLGEVPGAGPLLQTRNAGQVTLYGAEVSLVALITENDLVSLNTEYVDSEYDEYKYFTPGIGAPPYGSCIKTPATVDGFDGEITDCSGNSLVRAPEWTGRLSYTHTQPMGEYGTLIFDGAVTYSSDYYIANDFSELEHQTSFETYDASLTWKSASTKWSVTGWGKNLTEENYYTGGTQSPTLTDGVVAQIAPPRTFGVRVRYDF